MRVSLWFNTKTVLRQKPILEKMMKSLSHALLTRTRSHLLGLLWLHNILIFNKKEDASMVCHFCMKTHCLNQKLKIYQSVKVVQKLVSSLFLKCRPVTLFLCIKKCTPNRFRQPHPIKRVTHRLKLAIFRWAKF